MAKLPEILGALSADVLIAFGIPGGSVAQASVMAYAKHRADIARDILYEELRHGGKTPEDVAAEDEGIAVVHGYLQASLHGRARINLRLLAKAITRQLHGGSLVADEFFLYAESLAGLSRDEIRLIAAMLTNSTGAWQNVVDEFERQGWQPDRTAATAGRALRSGFVIPISGYGALQFALSPMLRDLAKTVDFADALSKEPPSA